MGEAKRSRVLAVETVEKVKITIDDIACLVNNGNKKKRVKSMARFKENDREQTILIPVSYADQLIPGTIEFAIDEIVEHHIDTSIFNLNYRNDLTGAKAYAPSVLLKILLLAYAKGYYSSRKIEQLCDSNIIFMAISGNTRSDHSTIAAFVSSMGEKIKTIFTEILIRCAQLDLVGGELFALDGCKISSNAAKEWSGTFKELESKRGKISRVLDQMMAAHSANDATDTESMHERCEKYRKKIEKIDAFLKSATPRKGKRSGENQSNITDNESAKMKTSHGVLQG